nr:Small GTPase superfamily [Ipomoea batatas]GME06016.1 Small GTPase superfamily [Ipomoea batatas]GME18972.1 Small GTPase superfamily [Ipomoea batatas]
MYRSSSAARFSDEFHVNMSLMATNFSPPFRTLVPDELPVTGGDPEVYNKKDVPANGVGERAVHLIPCVLILCALILWFFSHPI